MVTGQRAFQGKSQPSVASAILEKEPAPINTLKPLTPPALEHAIRRCLAKDPEERWQSARDLALELEWTAESGTQTGIPTPAGIQKKGRLWLAWSIAALLGVVAVLTAVFYRAQGRLQRCPSYASRSHCRLLVSSRYHPMDVTWPLWPQVQTDTISSGFAL